MRTWQMQRHNRNDLHTHQAPHNSVPVSGGQNNNNHPEQRATHSQIDGRPMSEHIYESPKFDRKFKAFDGFEPILGLNADTSRNNRNNSSMNSSHHTA